MDQKKDIQKYIGNCYAKMDKKNLCNNKTEAQYITIN